MTACTFTEVAPPARTPSRDNLFPTLERAGFVRATSDGEWIAGIQFRPHNVGGGGIHVDNCLLDLDDSQESTGGGDCTTKVFNGFHEAVKWRSLVLFASVSCSTYSDKEDIPNQAVMSFELSKSAITAFELYYGQSNRMEAAGEVCDDGSPFPQNPILATTDQYFPTATDQNDWTTAAVTDPVAGLALINDIIASEALGAPSVLHTSPGMATFWLSHELIRRDGQGNFRTEVGDHLVIAAPGYLGSSPLVNGVSPGLLHEDVAWVYVTGPTGIYLGDVERSFTLDHRRNNRFSVVEQIVLPFFDPTAPRFAVPIGRDCASLDIDLAAGGTEVLRIFNDHYLACVDPGSVELEAIDPEVYIGIEYASPSESS